MSKLLRHDYTYKGIVYDTETEGLNLFYSRPWQLSYLICKGPNIVKTFNKYLWWPNLKLSEGAARITKFDYNNYKSKAEDPKKVYEEFAGYLFDPEYINIGQNTLGYDIYIVNTLRRLLGMKPDWSYLPRAYDTACLGKAIIFTNPPPIEDDKFKWQWKLRNTWEKGKKVSLAKLGEHFNIPYEEGNLHDASFDIKLNLEVFKNCTYQLEI